VVCCQVICRQIRNSGLVPDIDDKSSSVSLMNSKTNKPRFLRWAILIVFLVFILLTLRWGGYLLVASDPIPTHVDIAVPLQGSMVGQSVRVAEAIALLQHGVADRALFSISGGKYWGAPIAPLARHYLETTYGEELAQRVDFCETGPEVNSTADEARVLARCIRERSAHTVIVVTSNYHTRRARMIWNRILHDRDPEVKLWMHQAQDPEFNPDKWWKKRLYAKTWLLEVTKLLWMIVVPSGS
jgi:uncharacterized SAM-binding protein YcdF (DUF218 family)